MCTLYEGKMVEILRLLPRHLINLKGKGLIVIARMDIGSNEWGNGISLLMCDHFFQNFRCDVLIY